MTCNRRYSTLTLAALALGLAACGADGGTGPADATALAAVTPAPGATGVSADAAISIRFSGPMASGVIQYVDLHHGDIAGETVPVSCAWSANRNVLTCTHQQPLEPGTHYTLHVGEGMMDADGRQVEIEGSGRQMGGTPVSGGMMGESHAGQPVGMMGPGWRHAGDDHLGMAFGFTTE